MIFIILDCNLSFFEWNPDNFLVLIFWGMLTVLNFIYLFHELNSWCSNSFKKFTNEIIHFFVIHIAEPILETMCTFCQKHEILHNTNWCHKTFIWRWKSSKLTHKGSSGWENADHSNFVTKYCKKHHITGTAITHHNCSKIMQKIWKTVYILRKIILCSQIWWTINLLTNIHNLQARMCNLQTKMYSSNIDIWDHDYSHSHCSLETQSSIQGGWDCTDLHHPLQPFSDLKPHLMRSIATAALGRSVHWSIDFIFSNFHPQCSGVGRVWTLIMDWVHTCPAM